MSFIEALAEDISLCLTPHTNILTIRVLENIEEELQSLIGEFNLEQKIIVVEIFPSSCFSKDNIKKKIRAAPRNINKGTGSQISFTPHQYGAVEIWRLSLTAENLIWLDLKFRNIKQLEGSFEDKWRKNGMDLSEADMLRHKQTYFPLITLPKIAQKRKRDNTASRKPNKVRAMNNTFSLFESLESNSPDSDLRSAIGEVDANNSRMQPEIGDIWGEDALDHIISISNDKENRIILTKTNTLAQRTPISTECFGSPKEVSSVKNRNLVYFTTSTGLFRMSEGVIVPVSENSNLTFHGLDQSNGKVYFSISNKILVFDELFGTTKDLIDFQNNVSLSDLCVYSSPSVLAFFVLDKRNRIRVAILKHEPGMLTWHFANSFFLKLTNGSEELRMNSPSGIAILPFPSAETTTLFVFVCDTKKQRIIRIKIDLPQLLQNAQQLFQCQSKIIWSSEIYFPLSISCLQKHKYYFSAFKNPEELEIEETQPEVVVVPNGTDSQNFAYFGASDKGNEDASESQDTGNANIHGGFQHTCGDNGEAMEGTGDSEELSDATDDQSEGDDEDSDGNDEENEDAPNFSKSDLNLLNKLTKTVALQLSHPIVSPIASEIARKFCQLRKQLPNDRPPWKLFIDLWERMYNEEEKLREDVLISTTGKMDALLQTSSCTLGRLVKYNIKSKTISTDLTEVSRDEFIRPMSNDPSVIYGSGTMLNESKTTSDTAMIGVWGKAAVRVNAFELNDLQANARYAIVADPSNNGMGRIVLNDFLGVETEYVVGLLDPVAVPVEHDESNCTALVVASLPFMPGSQITAFLGDITTASLVFNAYDKSVDQKLPLIEILRQIIKQHTAQYKTDEGEEAKSAFTAINILSTFLEVRLPFDSF